MIISAISYGMLQLDLRVVRASGGEFLSERSTLTSRRREMVAAGVEWLVATGQKSESFGCTIGEAILGIGDEGLIEGLKSPGVGDIVIVASVRCHRSDRTPIPDLSTGRLHKR